MAKRRRTRSSSPSPSSSASSASQRLKSSSEEPQAPEVTPLPAPAPAPARSADRAGSHQFAHYSDLYLQGSPAARNMGAVTPQNTYPHFTNGIYSADTRYWDLLEEILAKDPHIFGQVQTRIAAVLSRPRAIVPASADPHDQACARFVEDALDAMGGGGFRGLLATLLYGIPIGLSIVELDWRVSKGLLRGTLEEIERNPDLSAPAAVVADAVVPVTYMHRHPAQFVFDRDWNLFLAGAENRPLDLRRFAIYRHNPVYDNPYGVGLLERLFWWFWFKKNALKFWLTAAEKIGTPNLIGKYSGAFSDTVRDQMLEVLLNLQDRSVAAIPSDWMVDTLESAAKDGAFGNGLAGLCKYIDNQVTKGIAGSVLVSEGEEGGSRALGEIHDKIRGEKIEGDAITLMDVVNRQIIRPLVDYNFGPAWKAPRFEIDTDFDKDLTGQVERLDKLTKMGVPIPLEHIYDTFNIPMPEEGARVLRWDDTNLFQYHLQFGIIMVNEARAALGLPPLPEGDRPVNASNPTPVLTLPSSGNAGLRTGSSDPNESLIDELESEDEDDAEALRASDRSKILRFLDRLLFAGKKKS